MDIVVLLNKTLILCEVPFIIINNVEAYVGEWVWH